MTPAAPDRFDACAAAVMAVRGRFRRHDPLFGGPSAHGIGLGLLSVWVGGPADEAALRLLGEAGAARILRQMVWAPIGAARLAAGPDLALFAYAAEAGTMQALTDLQEELGVEPTGAADAATTAAARGREPALLTQAIRRRHQAWRHGRGLPASTTDEPLRRAG